MKTLQKLIMLLSKYLVYHVDVNFYTIEYWHKFLNRQVSASLLEPVVTRFGLAASPAFKPQLTETCRVCAGVLTYLQLM